MRRPVSSFSKTKIYCILLASLFWSLFEYNAKCVPDSPHQKSTSNDHKVYGPEYHSYLLQCSQYSIFYKLYSPHNLTELWFHFGVQFLFFQYAAMPHFFFIDHCFRARVRFRNMLFCLIFSSFSPNLKNFTVKFHNAIKWAVICEFL